MSSISQETPAYVISAEEHSAALFRQVLQTLISGSGVVGAGDYQVTQNGTPNLSVNVAAGMIWIPGTQGSTTGMQVNQGSQYATYGSPLTADFQSQGCYIGYNDGTYNLTIAENESGNPRIDCVVAQVQDAFYSGSSNQVVLAVLEGTAASSPSPPTIQNNCVVLAQIAVANGASSITNSNITDKRPFAAAGLASPGRTLATVTYNPGGSGAMYVSSSTAPAVVDGTNLVASITAPASGRVRLSFEALMATASGIAALIATVWNATASAEYSSSLRVNMIQQGSAVRCRYDALVTGLTPGTVYSLGPGYASSGSGDQVTIYAGATSAEAGAAWLEIAAA